MTIKQCTALLCLVVPVLLVPPRRAAAEKVIVEFTSPDGAPLVASGDPAEGPAPRSAQAVRKRVETRAAAIAAARSDLLVSMPAELLQKVSGTYENFPLIRMDIDDGDRLELLSHPQVAAVYDDRLRTLLVQSSLAYIGAQTWHEEGYTGQGTSVAILDSGIRYWNGFFGTCDQPGDPGCRVKVFEGFATLTQGSGNADPVYVANAEGHGTNVGGIVAAVAPGTDLLSLCVFAYYDPDPSTGFDGGVLASDADVAEALDWVVSHRDEYNIVAANLSLGSAVDPGMTGYCTGRVAGAYGAAFANTREAGVIPAVATGNDYVKTAVAPPSCAPSAMRVGAGYDDPAFGYSCGTGPIVPGAVTCFSDSSSLVDVIAPGNDIDAGGLYGYSGTSMAAPHVSGLIAAYVGRYGTSPVWTIERIRADAAVVTEIGPDQIYIHRYIRMGSRDALLAFDAGAVLESSFTGLDIPDGSGEGLEVSGGAACASDTCISNAAGNVYLDLNVEHEGTGDLVIELEAPDGRSVRREVEGDDELGLYNVNSILGSQHMPGVFDGLKGSPIEGTWILRLHDDTPGRSGKLYRAALLIDSARMELEGTMSAPAVGRPGEPFDVEVVLENLGNLDIAGAGLLLELVGAEGGEITDSAGIDPDLPLVPGASASAVVSLSGPQGSYTLQLRPTSLDPDLPPGFHSRDVPIDITYRTFASFSVSPSVPEPGQEARLVLLSRGIVASSRWDFGDGSTSALPEPVHVWSEPGRYVVTLTVTGPDGVSSTSRRVNVESPQAVAVDASGGGCGCAVAEGGETSFPWLPIAAAFLLLAVRSQRRIRRRAAAALLAAALLVAAGCEGRGGGGDADAEADDALSTGPWISLLDPADPSSGDIAVYLMLSSDDSSACDVTLEYRVAGGDFFPLALADPGDAAGASSSPGGVEHGFIWRSALDIPGDAELVQLRAAAVCGGADVLPVMSRPFTLLNFFESNPHAVLITEISTAEQNVPGEMRSDYVELFNTTEAAIPLRGWTLRTSDGSGGWDEFALDGLEIPAGGRLAVVEQGSEAPGGYELPAELPWDVVRGGAAAVIADHGRGVDFVRWGGYGAFPPPDLQWADDPALPIPQTLTVLVRVDERMDTDRASDFCVGAPTPGEPTSGCLARVPAGAVLITELRTQGQNDEIEILNLAGEAVNLGGWVLLWDGDDLGSGTVPLGSCSFDDGARLVLRDNGTAGRVAGGVMELGENLNIDGLIPIAVGIQNAYGDIVDFLAAGGSRVRWVDWSEDAPTPMPGPLTTLSRRPGDPDTDSSADFCLTEPNLHEPAAACLEPMGIALKISEVMPGRPDWVEVYNPGPDPVDLQNVYMSYTSPYYGVSVGDFRLQGTLAPGALAVVSEDDLPGIGEILTSGNIALAPEGDGSVALRDIHGYGIDFMMWGEPAGTPLWPDTWTGLGADTHDESDAISIQRTPQSAPDTDSRDDWCWAPPSPAAPNAPCE